MNEFWEEMMRAFDPPKIDPPTLDPKAPPDWNLRNLESLPPSKAPSKSGENSFVHERQSPPANSAPLTQIAATPEIRKQVDSLNALIDGKQRVAERVIQGATIKACDAMLDDNRIPDPTRLKLLLFKKALQSNSDRERNALAEKAGLPRTRERGALYAALGANVLAIGYATYELSRNNSKKDEVTAADLWVDGDILGGKRSPELSLRVVIVISAVTTLWLLIALGASVPATTTPLLLSLIRLSEVIASTMMIVGQALLIVMLWRTFLKDLSSWGFKEIKLFAPVAVRQSVMIALSLLSLIWTMALAGRIFPSVIEGEAVINPLLGSKIEAFNSLQEILKLLAIRFTEELLQIQFGLGSLSRSDLVRSNFGFALVYWAFCANIVTFVVLRLRALIFVPLKWVVRKILRS